MKQKCTFILKTSIALVLAVLVLVGSLSTVLAATVDMAESGWSTFAFHSNFSGSWETTNMTVDSGNSNHAYCDLYGPGSSSNSKCGMKLDGDWKVLSGYWLYDDTEYSGNWGSGADMEIVHTQSSGYIHLYVDFWQGSSNKIKTKQYAVSNLSTTVSVGGSSSNQTLTDGAAAKAVTVSNSGGSGGYTTTYSVKDGNNNDVTSARLSNGASGGNFTTPGNLTTQQTYTITATVTDSNSYLSSRLTAATDTITITVNPNVTTYTGITAAAKYSTDGTNYSTTLSGANATVSASSYTTGNAALTLSASSVSGYTFVGWVGTNGTIGGTSTSLTGATFTPTANSAVATARYKKNYTITKNTPTSGTGTITLNKTSAVAGESFTVTLAPAAGYKVSAFTVGGVDKKSSLSNNVYTGTASGSSGTIACSVTYALDDTLKLGVAGRFHVRTTSGGSTWMNTWGSGSGDWSDTGFSGDTAYIPFVWDSTAGKYKVETYASLAELSSTLSDRTPCFYVYNKTKSKYLYSSTSKSFTTSLTEVTLSEYSSKSSTYDTYLKFDSTSTDTPVILWFDATTNKLSYTVPAFYDVTVATATGGSVTAAPTRTTNGTSVTLTIHPDDGYQLNTISATKTGASGTTVSLTGSGTGEGATRTFTMPAYGVTVTPTFSKVNYALNKDSATNGSFKLTNSGGTEISTAQKGDTVKIVPTPATGYEIDKVYWGAATNPSTEVSASSGTYSVTMSSGAKYFKVTFKAINYSINVVKAGSGDGTVTVKKSTATVNTYNIGDSLSVTADPGTYSHLTSIVVSGAMSGTYTSSPQTLNMSGKTGTLTITVTFDATTYTGLSAVGKYSTDGSTYGTAMSTNPTISSTSGNHDTGVTVTAPDVSGYEFVSWTTTNGSFTNQLDKSTTFKPNANNAQAVAQYKKIFTITIGSNEAGEGAGTVTSNKASVVAGGSYTITLTPDSYSIVDTLKIDGASVNLTAGSGNVKTYTGTATADVTAVGKFTTDVKLGNKGFDGTTTWTEPKMTSNGDGTYSYIFNNVASGRNAQFKAKVGDSYKDYSSDTTFDDGGTSCTLTSINDGGVNYKLTTTEAVNVTIVYTASSNKITSVVLDPVSSVTYAITVGSPANATLTATYRSTTYNEGDTINARAGQQITFSATADTGKYVTGYTLGGTAVTSPYTVTASDGGKTLTCTTANKATITAKTNKSDRGSVAVSPNSAAPGDTITITWAEKAGKINTITATVNKSNASSETVTLYPTSGIAGTSAAFAPASYSAELFNLLRMNKLDLAATGASGSVTYTVPENTTSLAINATFDAYSAASSYYYNGYNTSGTVLNDYDAEQMTEVLLNGVPYSYYYVEGRTGGEQLMTVSKGSSDTKFYVETPDISDWNSSDPQIYWFDDNWGTFTTMHWVRNISGNKKLWYVSGSEIHPGQGCLITNGKTGDGFKQTTDMSAAEVAFGAVWIRTDMSDGKYNWQRYSDNDKPSDAGDQTVHYYYNDDDRYYGNVTGFNDTANTWESYNANNHTFARPHSPSGGYYVMVFYAGNTYTSGEGTLDLSSGGSANHDVVMWAYELPGGEDENVTVYAKDGSIRSESYGSTYANIADTKIYSDANHTTAVGTDHSGQISGQTYETYKAEKGQKLYIRTIINNTAGTGADTTANNLKYYVRGFCVNGVVSAINSGTSAGTAVTGGTAYDLTYTVPEDYEDKYIEITPIYYLADTTNNPIVTFRVLDFPKDKYNWGDTLYCYPFYGKLGSNNNAFGAYPGQPIVYYNGQYSIQIPQKSTAWDIYLSDSALSGEDSAKKTQVANTAVSGITMSNGYYDSVHRTIMGYGGNGSSSDHVQTYDYGDFYKIFNEKKPVDNIVYDFKYRTAKHNFETSIATTTTASTLESTFGTGGNGFELLKNFHGKNVDLFGTPLSGDAADPSKTTPVYVVSIGGVNGSAGVENIAGYYATEWKVFTSTAATPSSSASYTLKSAGNKSSIPPEVLILNDDDTTSFNTTTYPSAVSGKNITDWKALYTALEAYRGKPVYISYEAADAQIGASNYATSGGGGATRNDGRWLYSKTGESITANIKIQVSSDNGVTYIDNPASGASGHVDGLTACFTNSEVTEGAMTFATTIDPDKTFNFDAETTNANYMFVGWYMDDSNNTLITTDNEGSTERSGSYTFIAKFKLVTEGQLVLQHSKASSSAGEGTTLISAVVKNGENETVQTYSDAATITIPAKYIKSTNTSYTVEVTLKATPTGFDTYSSTSLDTTTDPDVTAAKFYNDPTTGTSGSTTTKTLSFTIGDLFSGSSQIVNSLMYQSSFTKTEFTYDFTFSYKGRLGSTNQSFRKAGKLTAAQVKDYVTGSAGNYTLDKAFITGLAPHESNFNETLIWTITNKTISSGTAFTQTYTTTVKTTAGQGETIRSTARTVTFNLPYAHTNGVAVSNPQIGNSITSENLVINLNYGDLIKNGGNYVTAPETVTNLDSEADDKTEYFQYWEIYTAPAANRTLVSKCYNTDFNYLAYDSYYIIPVYSATQFTYGEDGSSTSISYLDTTRNQWNNSGNGGYTIQAARDKASDLLFNDFALSYGYNGERLYENNDAIDGQNVEVGFIVEKVQKMDLKQDGTYDSDVSKYIPTASADIAAAKTNATNAINNITNSTYGAQAGTGTYKSYTKYKLDRTALDNKNRIEFFYALYNAYGDSDDDYIFDSKTTNKNYVYRAYSYIKVGDTYTLTDDPAYFIMYDEATK